MLQRACDALGLRDWTVAWLRFYMDPVSPAALFRFFTGNLPGWRRPTAWIDRAQPRSIQAVGQACNSRDSAYCRKVGLLSRFLSLLAWVFMLTSETMGRRMANMPHYIGTRGQGSYITSFEWLRI